MGVGVGVAIQSGSVGRSDGVGLDEGLPDSAEVSGVTVAAPPAQAIASVMTDAIAQKPNHRRRRSALPRSRSISLPFRIPR